MKELELLHDSDFREKVRVVEGFLNSKPPEYKHAAREAMLRDRTRGEYVVYHAAIADDQARILGMNAEAHGIFLEREIERAGLEYDFATT